MAARIGEAAAGTVSASIIICHATSATAVTVWIVVVVVIEEDGFGGGRGFEGCCCEFFVEFAGTPAPDAVGDQGNDQGEADESDNTEDAGYRAGVGKESKTKFGLANIPHKKQRVRRETKEIEECRWRIHQTRRVVIKTPFSLNKPSSQIKTTCHRPSNKCQSVRRELCHTSN